MCITVRMLIWNVYRNWTIRHILMTGNRKIGDLKLVTSPKSWWLEWTMCLVCQDSFVCCKLHSKTSMMHRHKGLCFSVVPLLCGVDKVYTAELKDLNIFPYQEVPGFSQYKRPYRDVLSTWVAKSAPWYMNDPL